MKIAQEVDDEKLHIGNFSVLGSPECLGILKLCTKSVSEVAFSQALDDGNLKYPEEEFEGSSKLSIEDARQVEPFKSLTIYVISSTCRFETL